MHKCQYYNAMYLICSLKDELPGFYSVDGKSILYFSEVFLQRSPNKQYYNTIVLDFYKESIRSLVIYVFMFCFVSNVPLIYAAVWCIE